MSVRVKRANSVKQYLHLLLEEELVDKLDSMAKDSNTSKTDIVRKALADYYDKWLDRRGT